MNIPETDPNRKCGYCGRDHDQFSAWYCVSCGRFFNPEDEKLMGKDAHHIALLKEEARGLLDDPPGTNPEYERGMCELIARVMSRLYLHGGETTVTARIIGKEIGGDWE